MSSGYEVSLPHQRRATLQMMKDLDSVKEWPFLESATILSSDSDIGISVGGKARRRSLTGIGGLTDT